MITNYTDPPSVLLDEGEKAILSCTASGSLRPTIQWFNETTELIDTVGRVSISVTTPPPTDLYYITSELSISSSERMDTGGYSCVASNDIGSDAEQNFTITVNCKSSTYDIMCR